MPIWHTLHLPRSGARGELGGLPFTAEEWNQALDQLQRHGPMEWTDPELTDEEAAHAHRLGKEALARLRTRALD